MESRKAYIYQITNPCGKIYIGSTVDLKDRIYRYKNAKLGSQFKIKHSILKYGWDNHIFKIIFECEEIDRYKYEAFYGHKFQVLGDNGLNLSLPNGEIKGYTKSDSTKLKISLCHKGKKISDEQKKQMSISLKKTFKERVHPRKGKHPWNKGKDFLKGDKNPMYGVVRPLQWRIDQSNRMKKDALKGSSHPKSRIIIDINAGVYYYGLIELHSLIGGNYSTLRGKLNGSNKNNTPYRYV
jgi:group I intron endonuclease